MAPAVTELLYPHSAHSWTRRLAMYPRLRPPQRGQTKPLGHRCAVRCSPHRTSSPKHERNSLTVMMGFLFNRLGFFISDMISPFVRLIKLDIHQNNFGVFATTLQHNCNELHICCRQHRASAPPAISVARHYPEAE